MSCCKESVKTVMKIITSGYLGHRHLLSWKELLLGWREWHSWELCHREPSCGCRWEHLWERIYCFRNLQTKSYSSLL